MSNYNDENNGRDDDIKILFAEVDKCLKDVAKQPDCESKVNKLSYAVSRFFILFKKKSHISYVTYLHLKKRIERLEKAGGGGYKKAS